MIVENADMGRRAPETGATGVASGTLTGPAPPYDLGGN